MRHEPPTASLDASHPRTESPPSEDSAPAADDTAIAIAYLRDKPEFQERVKTSTGIQWARIGFLLADQAPDHAKRSDTSTDWGFGLVKEALERLYPGEWTTEIRPHPRSAKGTRTWVMLREYALEPESSQDTAPSSTATTGHR